MVQEATYIIALETNKIKLRTKFYSKEMTNYGKEIRNKKQAVIDIQKLTYILAIFHILITPPQAWGDVSHAKLG